MKLEDGIDVSAELAQLRKRVEQLEDERAILATLYRYAHAIDYGLQDEWLDCFTDDAVYEATHTSESVREAQSRGSNLRAGHRGKTELTAFIEKHRHAPEHYHKHLLIEPRIALDGDSAHVVSYFVRLDANEDDPGGYLRTFGRYFDELVRCEDGRWRLSARKAELEMFQTSSS
jgi:3-phenylpropionate/cinnamic acid dioxygenase small subunit